MHADVATPQANGQEDATATRVSIAAQFSLAFAADEIETVKSGWERTSARESVSRLGSMLELPHVASLEAALEGKVQDSIRTRLDGEFTIATNETVTVDQIPDAPPETRPADPRVPICIGVATFYF